MTIEPRITEAELVAADAAAKVTYEDKGLQQTEDDGSMEDEEECETKSPSLLRHGGQADRARTGNGLGGVSSFLTRLSRQAENYNLFLIHASMATVDYQCIHL